MYSVFFILIFPLVFFALLVYNKGRGRGKAPGLPLGGIERCALRGCRSFLFPYDFTYTLPELFQRLTLGDQL